MDSMQPLHTKYYLFHVGSHVVRDQHWVLQKHAVPHKQYVIPTSM